MLRRTFIGLAATALLAFATPSLADALADIKARGTLRVAVPQDFPPFGSVGLDMAPLGYDIDMAAAIAERLGVTAELTPVTSANRVPYLQTNRVDLVISSLGRNAERELVIDFSDAYAPFYNGIFGDADAEIADIAALSGKSVGVTRGSVEDLALTDMVGDDVTVNRYEDNNGTISAFLSGQVDVIATGNVVAAAILERNPPRSPELKFLVKNSPCYIGLNKNEPELLAAVNGIIAEMKADGSLNEIAQKWLHEDLPADL
jgi:polar amino acid transport system substrate-binding protein